MVSALDDSARGAIQAALQATADRRAAESLMKRVKKSGLNPRMTIEAYEWGRFDLPQALPMDDLRALAFARRRENLILYGSPGTGKTHLANAIGIEACKQGLRVQFERSGAFVGRLIEAYHACRHNDVIARISRLDVLILDEFGYIPIDPIGAQLLFRVICELYEQKSLIITTNLSFSEWGQILGDQKLTDAVIDRIFHHSHLIQMTGESYRMQHSLILGLDKPQK